MIFEEFMDNLVEGKTIHDFVEAVRNEDSNATANPKCRDYAEGRFDSTITDEQRGILGGQADEDGDPTENVIGKSRDQIASRIRFRGFLVEDESVDDYLDRFSVQNRLTKAIVAVSKRQITDGSTAMSVSWRNGRHGQKGKAVVHTELWWDGKSGMFMSIDNSGETEWAVSDWKDRSEREFRTIYTDDKIVRYIRDGKGWEVDAETDWVRRDGTPIGIPIAHFPNGESGYGPYPPSTVAQVIASQDSLNRTLFFRQAAAALTGMQVYWGTGVKDDEDQTPRAGTFWSSPNPDSKFGSIAAGSIESLHDEVNDLRAIIAGAFPVPSYRISQGEWPSGVALQRADAPMLAMATQLIDVDRAGIVLLGHRACELYNVFGSGDELNEKSIIEADFESPESVDPGTQVEVDQALVDLYAALDDLPETLIRATGILKSDVADALIEERSRSMQVMADAMAERDQSAVDDEIDEPQ